MRPLPDSATIANKLKITSELRDLCLAMPRILSRWEEQLYARFEAFAAGAEDTFTVPELVRLTKIAYKWKRYELIRDAAARLPRTVIDSDRDLSSDVQVAAFRLREEETRGSVAG